MTTVKVTNVDGVLVTGTVKVVDTDGSTLIDATSMRAMPYGYSSVTNMLAQTSFYVAHRGGSLDFPEMSLYAYTQSAWHGVRALEVSVNRTIDGVWFGLHDQTLNRTSPAATSSFDPTMHTWAEVQQYQILGSVASNNPSQSDQPYMRWEEIAATYARSHVLFVDPKYGFNGHTAEFLNMLDAAGGPTRMVLKFYGAGSGAAALADAATTRGYQTWGYYYDDDYTSGNIANWQSHWSILGMDYGASSAAWTSVMSYGKPVIGHICPNAAAVTTSFGYGAKGVMVSGILNGVPLAA